MADRSTRYLQECLDRLQTGDSAARKELLNSTCQRLTELARKMLSNYWRLKRWEETDDIYQSAMVRLHRALQEVTPPTLRDYYRLATVMIRRELLDLSRHYFGPRGPGTKHASWPNSPDQGTSVSPLEKSDHSLEPSHLAVWTEFHQHVEALPEEEREVFDLVWYQGLSYPDAANLLGVSARTVMRRWQAACVTLHTNLKGNLPEL